MEEAPKPETSFKKPMLVGKIGRLPKKIQQTSVITKISAPEVDKIEELVVPVVPETNKSIPYEEPIWSGLPGTTREYSLEVLKNGLIIERINLTTRAFWVFGRLPNCDICMQHPTISRYHAVLQYNSEKTETRSVGFYIYDLESTHGTFLNKNRLKPRNYVKIHVGHMLKLGCSTRTYILNGPEEDAEEESSLTVTELKQKRLEELRQREERAQQEEERRKKQEEKGIDWGLGEDADEETDLSENPYAQTNNEDLYIENPKKALRGFFEREGLELEYDCSEQGMGQFLCKIELPVDDEMGRPIFAEVFHKGKKKEAVVQCALEACRILDRHGLLRQATHESKKRKPKNWEENDYYDSDDDTFLDRTGSVEKKREMRMNAKVPQKAETYENLLEKEKKISSSIKKLELELTDALKILETQDDSKDVEVDPLDSFMIELKKSKPSKKTVNKLKADLSKLKQEHGQIIKLVNIAKPATLPPLQAEYATVSTSNSPEKKGLPLFGKRKKIKLQLPVKEEEKDQEEDDEEEEELRQEAKEAIVVVTEPNTPENKEKKEECQKQTVEEKPTIRNTTEETDERRKKRNQRRIQQKQERAQIEKQKGYAEDVNKEDYNMWVPPSGQSGDGRTSLNDKLGY